MPARPSIFERWPTWSIYALAVAMSVATLLVRLSLQESFGEELSLVIFMVPISLSAYAGGLGPGLASTLVSAVAVAYFLIPPLNSFKIAKMTHVAQAFILMGVGAFISMVTEVLYRSRQRLRQIHDELEQRVEERTAELRHTVDKLLQEVAKRQQAEWDLRASEGQLRHLTSQLIVAQETERKRISLELHDDLGQSLMVLKMRVNAFARQLREDQQGLKDDCAQTSQYVNEIAEKVRRLSHELSPSILENMGLAVALRKFFDEFIKYQGIEINLDMDEISDLFSLEEQIVIYRVVQESFNNIAKHADATKVVVALKKQDNHVAFLMEDNGKGFDRQEIQGADAINGGLGLAAMQERVRMLGGHLNIESLVGQGTRISFEVPVGRKKIPN